MAKSMNGIVSLSDGAGTTIENGAIITGGINATSISSDEYNTRGKSKMESTTIIAASSTPYNLSYGTSQNIVFTGAVVQTVNLPQVFAANMGATFTIMRTSAVQMFINAPAGFTIYDEQNAFQNTLTLFSNNRIVTVTAINTGTSPAMWALTYSQSPNTNLAVTISNTQNITGTKSFGLVNFNSLPSFIGTLGTIASNNFITKAIADASYVDLTSNQTIAGTKSFSLLPEFTGTLGTVNSTSLVTRGFTDASYVNLTSNQTVVGEKSFSNSANFNGFLNVFGDAHFYLTANFEGELPIYTNPSPVWADNTFITRLYADSRYAQLATDSIFSGNNTFSGITTFADSIIANSNIITPTELGYVSGVTSSIQTQLANRVTLNTSQTITGAKTMNANFTISTGGYLLPLFPLSSTSMRIGLNSMQYSNAGSVDNIVFGINAMQGTTNGAYNNLSVRNVVIGTEAYQNTTYGTANSTHNDNVIIGHQAMKQHYYNNYDNVCIGSQNCKGGTGSLKSVMIGSKISVNSGQHTYSVIIGADNFPSTAINNGTIVGYGNFAFSTLTYANGLIIFGDNNMRNCADFNRTICIGSDSLRYLRTQFSTICIGVDSLNNLSAGGAVGAGYVTAIGSFINCSTTLYNSTILGTFSNCQLNNVCYIGGNANNVYQDLLPAGKTKLLTQTSYNTGTVNLTFEVGEHIQLDTNVSVVNLPQVFAKNIGARFTFYRDFTSNTCTLTTSNSFGLINNTGASATTFVIPDGKCYATIVATAVQPTSGVAIVCWFLINEDLNNEVSAIDADVTTLNYNTTAITYDDTSSPAFTSITSELRLNNNAVKFQTSATLTGTVGSLSTPLNSFYVLSGATGTLTLPTITTDLIGVRITFVKQNATGTWTLSPSGTDTFRFQGSVATATSLPMARTWTMCELMAESGVWNIINQNAGVDGYYYKDEISPTNITATIATWTNPIYEYYLVNNTGNITISLPLSSQVFIGFVLRFRKIGTLATTITLNIQAGSGQAIKFAGATANLTTGTLLSTTQTFASVMYISSNLWAVLG